MPTQYRSFFGVVLHMQDADDRVDSGCYLRLFVDFLLTDNLEHTFLAAEKLPSERGIFPIDLKDARYV